MEPLSISCLLQLVRPRIWLRVAKDMNIRNLDVYCVGRSHGSTRKLSIWRQRLQELWRQGLPL